VKRHAFDPVSFVFGLLFSFLAVFVLSGNNLADLYPLWVWTLPAMAVGLLVVLFGVRRLFPPPDQVPPSMVDDTDEQAALGDEARAD
jgi:hypothetical protein